jgi:hypothetical protein
MRLCCVDALAPRAELWPESTLAPTGTFSPGVVLLAKRILFWIRMLDRGFRRTALSGNAIDVHMV